MRYAIIIVCCCSNFFSSAKSFPPAIVLDKRDATAWLEVQTITGKVTGFYARRLRVFCNKRSFEIFVQKDSTFSFTVTLEKGENQIFVKTISGIKAISDTVHLLLGFNPEPVIKPYAISKGGRLELHMRIIHNPWKKRLHFLWSDDRRNPSPCNIKNSHDSVAIVNLPRANGTYYFNLGISTSKDTARFQTFVIKNGSQITVFDMDSTHAAWVDSAIIYEITPSLFVKNGSYDDIANKLAEIKQLGINTIWLQPVYNSYNKGQGYDIIDYFSLRKDFGTEAQLKALIDKAKQLQLKVLFDFVLNHTSIQHPYAQDCAKYGKASYYYNFYQHEDDGVQYSSFYKKYKYGFINYFWEDMVNLNYTNEEVQRWMIEACKYWVKKFDIDGYRFDAVWGINARAPSFSKRLQTELKLIKPDLLMLAEDKGSVTNVYKAGFDAAYDWTNDTAWISHWSWQYQYASRKNLTIFSYPDVKKRPGMLRDALFSNGNTKNLRLRFIENNDLPRFIKSHSVACTKMAAGLLFSLPGIPMIYNGQEIGFTGHPYSRQAIFEADKSIQSLDSNHLFALYHQLAELRKKYPALCGSNMSNVLVYPADKMFAFSRWENNDNLIIILNMDSIPGEATLNIKDILPAGTIPQHKHSFEDVLDGSVFEMNDLSQLKISMTGYGIRWLLLK